MHKVLEVNYGIRISQGRVYRLMKQMQLPKMSTVKPKFKAANKSNDKNCNNVLKQNFNPKEPNKAWCSDITYIKAGGRFYYLCVIIDLFSRRVIAYKLSRLCEKISVNSTTVIKNDIVERLEKQPLNFFTVYNKYRNLSSFSNSQSAGVERSGMEAD